MNEETESFASFVAASGEAGTPTLASPGGEVVDRSPFLPLQSVARDRIYEYWAWYLAPFRRPPVSDECESWVLGKNVRRASGPRIVSWQRRLAAAQTVKADPASALVRKPAGLAADREMYRRKGFLLCQRIVGEVGNADYPYQPYVTDMTGRAGEYLGCEEIVEELQRRRPWYIAQLRARMAELERRLERRGLTVDQIHYAEETLDALDAALRREQEYRLPTPGELRAFFLRYERLRLEGQLDARFNQQRALARLIEQTLTAEREALGTGAVA